MTREGSIKLDGDDGDHDVKYPHDRIGRTLRNSSLHEVIMSLQKITSVPQESQETIDNVLDMLQSVQNASNHSKAAVMAEANDLLQGVGVTQTE